MIVVDVDVPYFMYVLLEETGATIDQLAEMLNVHVSTAENWMYGITKPRGKLLFRIREFCKINKIKKPFRVKVVRSKWRVKYNGR